MSPLPAQYIISKEEQDRIARELEILRVQADIVTYGDERMYRGISPTMVNMNYKQSKGDMMGDFCKLLFFFWVFVCIILGGILASKYLIMLIMA